jgi:hypoxanthine phosphoribosyltransferase
MPPLKMEKLLSEAQIQKRVRELGAEIDKIARTGEPITLICVLKGSFIFFSDLIRAIDSDVRCEFLGVSSYGDGMKSSGEIKLTLDLTDAISGRTVILVEDIVDSGLTLAYLKRSLAAREPKKVLTCALLYKPEALQAKLKLDYVGFEIGKEFVVGYGLDYQGYYRNLPYVAQVVSLN